MLNVQFSLQFQQKEASLTLHMQKIFNAEGSMYVRTSVGTCTCTVCMQVSTTIAGPLSLYYIYGIYVYGLALLAKALTHTRTYTTIHTL